MSENDKQINFAEYHTCETKKKWTIGAKIWFVLMIIAQWIVFINYVTAPIIKYSEVHQRAAIIAGISGAIGTFLYLWLLIKKRKTALMIILGIAALNIIVTFIQGNVSNALMSIPVPLITYWISKDVVE